jgi:hypothetical protein
VKLFGGSEPKTNGDAAPPILLHAPIGRPVGIDAANRAVIIEAMSDSGIGMYRVRIPICLVKALAGDVIAKEANNEAAAIAKRTKIVKP